MKIIVGLWSGGAGDTGRFFAELGALQGALYNHGCENIAAVSVGNGDLETLDSNGSNPDAKRVMVDLLLYQIAMTRNLLRQNGCCDIPVTHTDAWDELGRQDDSGVSKVSWPSPYRAPLLTH